jgi:uracil-DNA glycosylase
MRRYGSGALMLELPLYPTIESARLAAEHCRACERATTRTQVVFGHGNPNAALMVIGEFPSATDDQTGKPFTGPAGKLLDAVLAEVGIRRSDIWITNLVRCFQGDLRSGRMEHRPVRAAEVRACKTWLDLELRYVNPRVLLAIGAPAAKQIIGRDFRLKEQRGTIVALDGGRLAVATIQPAYVMRLASLDPGAEVAARAQLVADIRLAATTAGLLDDNATRS